MYFQGRVTTIFHDNSDSVQSDILLKETVHKLGHSPQISYCLVSLGAFGIGKCDILQIVHDKSEYCTVFGLVHNTFFVSQAKIIFWFCPNRWYTL